MINKYIKGVFACAVSALALVGCNDDVDYQIYDGAIVSGITTGDATTTATTAVITGSVNDLSSQNQGAYTVGVVYSTEQATVNEGTRVTGTYDRTTHTVTATIKGLQTGKTYYYATFVTLQNRVTYYGDTKSFITTDAALATAQAASVTSVNATLGGTLNGVDDKLAADDFEYGIALSGSASLADYITLTANGTSNSFTVNAEKLVPNTLYYYAAYMVINDKPVFGDICSFTTAMSGATATVEVADYVDMGLSHEWARYNIGADAETQTGGLYGYGDVKGLKRSTVNDDYAEGSIQGTSADIARAAGMGMMPTVADWQELINASTIESAVIEGVAGVKFTSKITGNHIFFPSAGYREGEDVFDGLNAYWTADHSPMNDEYAYICQLGDVTAEITSAARCQGFAVRAIREPFVKKLNVDNSLVRFCNKDGNGVDGRIELYNEWDPEMAAAGYPINRDFIKFNDNLAVTFSISGLKDNLKEDGQQTFITEMCYVNSWWSYQHWGGALEWSDIVTGDGTFKVSVAPQQECIGTAYWVVEIPGLWAALKDPSKVKVNIESIIMDSDPRPVVNVAIDPNSGLFNNKDGNGVDGRIEIYNEYSSTKELGVDYSSMTFPAGAMIVEFRISGVDGNLKDGAKGSYKADMTFADADWWPSYWGGQCGTANVTADGTYKVICHLDGDCQGAVVWCIELYDLWADLVDSSKVKTEILNIWVPGNTKK